MKKLKDMDITNDENLVQITRVVLIIGILLTTTFILFNLFKPEDQNLLFALENEHQELGNYPTSCAPGENVTFHYYIQNEENRDYHLKIAIFQGDNDTIISEETGATNVTYLWNETITVKAHQDYRNQTTVVFAEQGENQIVGVELYTLNDDTQEYEYLQGYTLFLRINVTLNSSI